MFVLVWVSSLGSIPWFFASGRASENLIRKNLEIGLGKIWCQKGLNWSRSGFLVSSHSDNLRWFKDELNFYLEG